MSTYKTVTETINEIEHWLRLSTLLHGALKKALLCVLHNKTAQVYTGLPEDPAALYQELANRHLVVGKLERKKVFRKEQVNILLPPNDNKVFSKQFDITLIVVLIRHFTTLAPPAVGWSVNDLKRHEQDKSIAAFVIRAREWRNFLHHTDPKDIDEALFKTKWEEGEEIISGLGYAYNTKHLLTISLDPKHEV